MANKGILVSDAATGESVACIDAQNNDDADNPRIIQQFAEVTSLATDIQGTQTGVPLRSLNFGTSGPGGNPGTGDSNASPPSSDVSNNLLDVSDASAFILYFTINFSGPDSATPAFIRCMPLAFNNAGNEVAFCFPPSVIRVPIYPFVDTTLPGNQFVIEADLPPGSTFLFQDQINTIYISVPLVYSTYGLKYVGITATADLENSLILNIFGHAISGRAADSALNTAIYSRRYYTSSSFPGMSGPPAA